jgi:hypothetical protein
LLESEIEKNIYNKNYPKDLFFLDLRKTNHTL